MERSTQTPGSSRMTQVSGDGVIVTVAKRAWDAFRKEDDDYEKNGLLYCGKCNTPKVTVLHLPHGETIVPCMCACENEKWEQMREAEKAKSLEMEIKRIRTEGVRADLRDATFQNADPDVNRKYMGLAKRYVDHWDEMRADGVGFLFSGRPGNGKTYTAACIANALIDRGVPVMMTSFPAILEGLAGIGRGGDRNGFLRSFERYELLVIDDLGAERRTDYGLEVVFSVIDRRYADRKPLILTTNMAREDMEREGSIQLRRIYDRVLEMCVDVAFDGDGLRRELGEQRKNRARKVLYGMEAGADGGKAGAD